MNKFYRAGAHIQDWHSFTAHARLCCKLSGSEDEDEGVFVCLRLCVWFQIYMRDSPLGVYCSNEIQSRIRDQRMRRSESAFVVQTAEKIRKVF